MAPWIPEYDDTVVHDEEEAAVLSGDDPKTSFAPLHESSSPSSSFRAASRIQNRSRDDGSLREGRRQRRWHRCGNSRGRSVSFGATDDDDAVVVVASATIHAVLHRNDYTDSERAASWYDRRELREMKARADADADAGGRTPPPRGLENRTRAGKRRRCLRVLGAYRAVGISLRKGDDEASIAAACFRISAPRVIEARVTGWRDEIAAWGAVLPRRRQRRPRTTIPVERCSKSLHHRWAPGMHHTTIFEGGKSPA